MTVSALMRKAKVWSLLTRKKCLEPRQVVPFTFRRACKGTYHEEVIEYGELLRRERALSKHTVGRALMWNIVPEGLRYDLIDRPRSKKAISKVINQCYERLV
jgi:hypothetical protein